MLPADQGCDFDFLQAARLMARRIEDYALIGDTHTVALVGRDGSIDWLCVPRIDSAACFAALLGDADNGRWLLAPEGEVRATRRRYRGDTLILETEFETPTGAVAVIDFMPVGGECDVVDLVRLVEGRAGEVADDDRAGLPLRLRQDRALGAEGERRPDRDRGPGRASLHTPVELEGKDFRTVGRFTGARGRDRPVPALLLPVLRARARAPRPAAPAAGDRGVLARLDRPLSGHGDWRDAVRARCSRSRR